MVLESKSRSFNRQLPLSPQFSCHAIHVVSISLPPIMGDGIVPSKRITAILIPIAWDLSSGGTTRRIEFVAGIPFTKVKNIVKYKKAAYTPKWHFSL